ncbi:acyl-CoA/acyl-ACP dehydrogenase [Streptomyces sp. NBC_01619]|uniref:acyl-CoA dehydrogenase family protein n=1 Tax=Streptomyces sp. NBC_01619 TaxID=2975901 RepID=UPI00224FE1CF|nr:acyl-CoA dehydrogenase family protein [Streptomyces sp. NBC_01619]MCX4515835.1 acyl-CoA/acyl-ACP dehydrogenase [Streptomyces sp. NBC_01619]
MENSATVRLSAEIDNVVRNHVREHGATRYPGELMVELAQREVFAATVPSEYRRRNIVPQPEEISYTLARSWQALAGLVGTHLKLCRQVAEHGTSFQKEQWLPAMAAGDIICARGYQERGRNDPRRLKTRAERHGHTGLLTGEKHWVTNARDADRIVVIAVTDSATVGVWVDPSRPGVCIGKDLPRAGMHGVSLAEIYLDRYEFDPATETIGGWNHDLTAALRSYDVTSYATRAVAAADSVFEGVLAFTRNTLGGRSESATGGVTLRIGELAVLRQALRSAWHSCTSSQPSMDPRHAKVFCTSTLQRFLAAAVPLCGGTGFAGVDNTIARQYQDAIALTITGQPNDLLLQRLGEEELTS